MRSTLLARRFIVTKLIRPFHVRKLKSDEEKQKQSFRRKDNFRLNARIFG